MDLGRNSRPELKNQQENVSEAQGPAPLAQVNQMDGYHNFSLPSTGIGGTNKTALKPPLEEEDHRDINHYQALTAGNERVGSTEANTGNTAASPQGMELPPGPVRRRHARWATESMRQALRDVHTGQRNMTAAARHHGIPRQTLVDYYKESCETGEHATIMKRRGGRQAPDGAAECASELPVPGGAAGSVAPAPAATPRDEFHRTLERTLAHLKLDAAGLFTVSEVGLRACGHEPDADKADPLHVLACVGASGRCLTPLVVFKEDAVPEELEGEASLGFHIATSKSGVVTAAIFARWMAEFVVEKPAGPALLLVNDDRHLGDESGAALRLAADSDVAVLMLPEGEAAALQPLDRVLLRSLASRYDEESRSWHGQAAGQCPLRACFRHIFSTAWHQTMASPLLVMAAFQVTGLSPQKRDADAAGGGERPAGSQALRAGVMAQLLRAVGHQWPPRISPSLPVWFPRPLR